MKFSKTTFPSEDECKTAIQKLTAIEFICPIRQKINPDGTVELIVVKTISNASVSDDKIGGE